jgi:hypothetical protein
MRSLVLASLLLLTAPAAAQAPAAGFRALMLVTPDPAALRRAWHGPQQPPRLNVTTRARRGVPVEAMIVLSGCRAGADGKCRVTAEFSVLRPDGSLYRRPVRGTVWGKAPAAPGRMMLGDGSAGFRLEAGEPTGTYRLVVKVTDEVAGVSAQAEQAVAAAEAE